MSFESFDLSALANLLRQSDQTGGDPDDSDDDDVGKSLINKSGPGHIGKAGGSGDAPKARDKCQLSSSKKPEIWSANEVSSGAKSTIPVPVHNDPRKTPKYEMYYRQSVTTEDVFLQMGNKTPSSASCEDLVVEIGLPDEDDFSKIQLNLKEQAIDLRSPIHFLYLGLPHPIDTKDGHAKWDSDKQKLTVTLKLRREFDALNR